MCALVLGLGPCCTEIIKASLSTEILYEGIIILALISFAHGFPPHHRRTVPLLLVPVKLPSTLNTHVRVNYCSF